MPDVDRAQATATLAALCTELRVDILKMIHEAGSGHPGGSLSAIDVMAALFAHHLRHDPKRPDWPQRDRFVLSKGHGAPALYALLAHHGYFDKQLLSTLRQLGSPLQGHPVAHTAPGVEACTGSLGQGLSVAHGMALGGRLDGNGVRAFCVMGDGELQEGQVWEAAMSAGVMGVDNLIAIVDHNGGQLDGTVGEIMEVEPIPEKFEAFGWLTRRIDGHDYTQILDALTWAVDTEGKPKLIVADTIKGKGVSYMEGQVGWHGAAPSDDQLKTAIDELRGGAGS